MERTRILNAGIGLDNLDTFFTAANWCNARTQGAELGIVNCVEKVPAARQQLRPRIQTADRLRRPPRRPGQPGIPVAGPVQTAPPHRDPPTTHRPATLSHTATPPIY